MMQTPYKLSREVVANIVIRHWPIKQCGTGKAAMALMKEDFEKAIDHWYLFSLINGVGAKELIRILKDSQ